MPLAERCRRKGERGPFVSEPRDGSVGSYLTQWSSVFQQRRVNLDQNLLQIL